MKYLLLDANIYLNIAVNRRKDVNNNLLDNFSKLLQYGEIRIILPDIVRYETFKHLEDEISKVGEKLKYAKKSIEDVYWVSGIEKDTFNIENYKKDAKNCIQEAHDYFNKNKEDYILSVESQINSIFKSKYTISINDGYLLNKALKRRIYKKAPCHKKESYADALIVETLINLKKYIDIDNDEDIIYFISDNSEDFSKSKEKYKDALHPHIISDLKKFQLNELVEYRLNFGKFIMTDLLKEIENANVKKEFEKEFEEEQAMEKAAYYSDLEDMNREAGGLTSLSSLNDWVYKNIVENKEVMRMLNLFSKINKTYIDLEEMYSFYWDEFSTYLTGDRVGKPELISKFNKFIIQNKIQYYCYSIEDVIDWVNKQESQLDFDFYGKSLPDYIDMSEDIILTNANKEIIILSWSNVELQPESKESHTIYCDVKKDHSKKLFAGGRVEIIYGYMEIDSCGNAGDGLEQDVIINLEQVVEVIENVYKELVELRDRNRRHTEYISQHIIIGE